MTPPKRALVAALALVALSTLAAAAVAQERRFGEQTSVLAVEIPVQVTRDGEPVRGLTRENFVVQEGRTTHPILSFEEIDLSLVGSAGFASASVPTMPAAARRHFLLLFDLSFSDSAGIVKARHAARELVTTRLHQSDLVAVATYSEARGADLLLGFTSDRYQVEAALLGLGLLDPIERVHDPLKLMIAGIADDLFAIPGEVGEEDTAGGGGPRPEITGDITPAREAIFLEHLRGASSMAGKSTRDYQVNQVLALSDSLAELAGYMEAVDGRKHVVYFSEGFDSALLLGTDDAERLKEISQQVEFGQIGLVNTNERYGDSAGQRGLFDMLERFRRSDCAIQAVDVGGLSATGDIEPRASGQDGLFIMADQTGGELYRNYNDLGEAMGDLLESTSVTYLLTIQPRSPGPAGTYHPLKIKLRDLPRGTRISHRPGYHTPRPYSGLEPLQRRLSTAARLLTGVDGGDLPVSLLAAPVRSLSGELRVLTLVEVDGLSLLAGDSSSTVQAETFAYAIDPEGRIRDFFSQSTALEMEKVGDLLRQRGFKLLAELDLPPGEYLVRVLVRNPRTGRASLRSTRVEVPDLLAGDSALLPPFFIEPDGTWLLGRAHSDDAALEYPLMNGQQPIIPAALPTLPTQTPIPLLLMGLQLARGPLSAQGTLTSADGSRSAEAHIVLTGRLPQDHTGLDRITATFQTGSILPGEYRLDVTLTDPINGSAVSSSIPILAR